ncbi:redoxin domain-containing protein [Haloarcula amylovorans]|uniref:redoxin domain-containing protein n=1 Tax=Haloarcula amylovorans TaxID=2562280 RepID=UPI001430F5B3|nr:redoxin domain-containing protein [Halomicroarcula amylolytica]
MTEPNTDGNRYFDFELPNVGAGSETLHSATLAAEHEYVLAVLLRNHYCPLCRELVRELAGRYDEFATRGTAVVPVLPDIRERALVWHRRYELPFPMLADPAADVVTGDRRETAPDEFETFEPFQRTIPSLPGVALLECVDDSLKIVSRHGGPNPQDVPTIDSLLRRLDAQRDSDVAEGPEGIRADT